MKPLQQTAHTSLAVVHDVSNHIVLSFCLTLNYLHMPTAGPVQVEQGINQKSHKQMQEQERSSDLRLALKK